jgi:hypothetical protein
MVNELVRSGQWRTSHRGRQATLGPVLASHCMEMLSRHADAVPDALGRSLAVPERALLIRVELDQPIQKRPALIN